MQSFESEQDLEYTNIGFLGKVTLLFGAPLNLRVKQYRDRDVGAWKGILALFIVLGILLCFAILLWWKSQHLSVHQDTILTPSYADYKTLKQQYNNSLKCEVAQSSIMYMNVSPTVEAWMTGEGEVEWTEKYCNASFDTPSQWNFRACQDSIFLCSVIFQCGNIFQSGTLLAEDQVVTFVTQDLHDAILRLYASTRGAAVGSQQDTINNLNSGAINGDITRYQNYATDTSKLVAGMLDTYKNIRDLCIANITIDYETYYQLSEVTSCTYTYLEGSLDMLSYAGNLTNTLLGLITFALGVVSTIVFQRQVQSGRPQTA